jgi:Protein of unknown function (DUF2721)
VTDNPYTVLTAVVAPAILTNACSVLAMGTTNRVARVADRTRAIVAELECKGGGGKPRTECAAEIERLRVRMRLLIRGLRSVYAALGAFATTALLAIAGAVGSYFGPSVVFGIVGVAAALTGTTAVGALVAGCAYIVMETRLALASVEYEAQNVLMRAGS